MGTIVPLGKFPENYKIWDDRQYPEYPQGEKSSSPTHESDLARIRKNFGCEVARSAQADAEPPHANSRADCSLGVME